MNTRTSQCRKDNSVLKYTAQEVVDILSMLAHDKKQAQNLKSLRPGYKFPVFSHEELLFVRDLIFLKDGGSLVAYVADNVMGQSLRGLRFNGPNVRRLKFLHGFLATPGNAAKAAIYAGYSPKSAKQQGYRSLKYIQRAMSQL